MPTPPPFVLQIVELLMQDSSDTSPVQSGHRDLDHQ